MIRSDWTPALENGGSLENLADLRNHLVHQLALLLTGASSLSLWLTLPQNPFPALAFILFALLLGLGLLVLALADPRPDLARNVLVWGLTGGLLAALGLFATPWLPFLGLLLLFVNTILISGSELATADFWMRVGPQLLTCGVDALVIHDDLGSNTGTFFVPEVLRRLYMPHLRRQVRGLASTGAR